MQVRPPKIDPRDREALLRDLRALIPFYISQWRVGESGPGRALVEAFVLFQREVISRLNRVPDKLFLAFLDQLGLSLLPALPARAPVVFTLAQGTTENVVVPAGTQVAAGETVFQTEAAFVASPAALKAVFSVVPKEDLILDHLADVGKPETAVLFPKTDVQKNLQEHSLYLGDSKLFNLKAAGTIVLEVNAKPSNLLPSDDVEWEWGETIQSWRCFTKVPTGAGLKLTKPEGEIKEIEINGITSRWIRCRVKDRLRKGDPLANLTISDIKIAPSPSATVPPDAAFSNDIPLPLEAHSGTAQSGAAGPSPSITLAADASSIDDAYNEMRIHITGGEGRCQIRTITDYDGTSKVATVDRQWNPVPNATSAYRILAPLSPFGSRPRQGDTFYLASQEAFSKKEAGISLHISGSPGGAGLPIERVHGIGKNFRDRLQAAGIRTTTDLTRISVPQVAEAIRNKKKNIPASRYLTRARNIREAAAKQFYNKVVNQPQGTEAVILVVPRLSWEYWNGKGWAVLEGLQDTSTYLLAEGEVTFPCPQDIAATEVAGQENYWIRVRIISGDYGQERFEYVVTEEDVTIPGKKTTTTEVTVITADIQPPRLSSLTLSYTLAEEEPPASIVTLNNLQYTLHPHTASFFPFSPFIPMDDEHQALYLGFDRPLIKDPFSILVTLKEQDYPEAVRPRIVWEYSRSDTTQPWGRLSLEDGTNGLIRNGIIKFIGPSDGVTLPLFGQNAPPFWIRAVDVEDRFEEVPVPRITGIYPNAAWVIHTESINDERFGSSDGTANQSFRLSRAPVISATVWVNELGSLTDEEIVQLKRDPKQIQEEKDLAGNLLAFWVRWTQADDLDLAGRDVRVYLLDNVQGLIQFGDGHHGKIPPIGLENLKADYKIGGGSHGNVPAGEIKDLKSGLARIDKVTNPVAASGGADTESITSLTERGPQFLRHRDRAVTVEDFEWLARDSSREIAKVRGLPNFDDQWQTSPGWVTVLIVPHGTEAQPTPSPGLKQRVRAYLAARAPNVVTGPNHLVVAGPVYLLFSVTVDLYPVSLDVAATLEQTAIEQLEAFLHPLTGGFDRRGWQFGQVPCLSDIVAVLQGIEGVDHIEHIAATVEEQKSEPGKPAVMATLRMEGETTFVPPPYTLVSSGDHEIHLKSILKAT